MTNLAKATVWLLEAGRLLATVMAVVAMTFLVWLVSNQGIFQ